MDLRLCDQYVSPNLIDSSSKLTRCSVGCLILLSLLVSVPNILGQGKDLRHEGHVVEPDSERAPLLEDH
jgi:hypothetical protein